ncbi:hypothetical protein BN946_scf184687.g10 [Trametes cinnabarina]|uniref:3-hydroxyisobutyryl-CoA hydrolase n=1 Tax=Pycnoporus cinnabarinus TaxID=5643 RepID=A0A060S5U3_PYCCI|nr:hypothetical protein BN946_scf184687.g10 [Trametes cinnabarina]
MALPNYANLGFTTIRVQLDGAVAVVTLARTKERNTFIGPLAHDIVKAYDILDRDDRVRVVVLTAEPNAPAFCAGVSGADPHLRATNADPFVPCKADLSSGWERILDDEAEKEGEHATVTPDSPLLDGLYYSILPNKEDVFPAALALAKDLAENTSGTAIAVTKALVWRGYDNIEEQHIVDSRAIRILARSPDAEEGALAFKQRRAPKFGDKLSRLAPWMPWWREINVKHRKSKL